MRTTMDELQEMQAQMALLKEKLNNEEIVNDQLLRDVTRLRVRRVNRNVWIETICVLFVITVDNGVFHQLGCSWWFIGGTTAMMLACLLATVIPHRRVKEHEIMQGDLLTVAKQVRRLRQAYDDWLKIGIPMALVWVIWLLVELYFQHTDNLPLFVCIAIGILGGGAVGGWIGGRQHKKYVREMDEIIRQIEAEHES